MAEQHDEHIPLDSDFDSDSAYFGDSDDIRSMTTTLRSAIQDYHYENGRRYHAYRAGQYWGPNDETQATTLDVFHHVQLLMLDGNLFKAPIGPSPQRVLDVGTGTGIWAIDFADLFPDCQVIGVDLSPTQPQEVPPNVHWEVDDVCSEWLYSKQSFDFIHIRAMYGSVADWPKLYEEVYNHLKPGGWIEQVEMGVVPKCDDGSVKPDSVFARWGEISLAAGDAFGKTLRIVDESRDGIINAGFKNVSEHRYKLPIGGWSEDQRLKTIGIYNRFHWELGLEGFCMFLLTNHLGWKREEVEVYLAQMREMLRDRNVHAYQDCSVVFGQKPPETPEGTT